MKRFGPWAALVALSVGCFDAPPPLAELTDGTAAMTDRLDTLFYERDPGRNRFANESIVQSLLSRSYPTRPDQRLLFTRALAEQLLYAGRHDEAIAQFTTLLDELDAYQAAAPPSQRAPASFREGVEDLLAAAYLRRAETSGCIDPGGTASCAIPTPATPWTDAENVRNALALYRARLAEQPDHAGARWMLNLGHMMLGEYPDGVPEEWRIPPEVFEPEGDVGGFRDIAPELGLDVLGNVGGAAVDDFDGDGWLDIVASSWGPADTLRFFRSDGSGGFVDHTNEAGVLGLTGGGNLFPADFDNDGDLDLFVPRGGWLSIGQPNSLLRNRGDMTFEDVTESAGLLAAAPHPTQVVAWYDLNGDGWLDLFVGNESYGEETHPTQLFLSNRDGTFRDVAAEAGAQVVGIIKGVTAGDIDNDGDGDLYITRVDAPNVLLVNDGGRRVPTFTDRTESAGVAEPTDAFPTWFWDYDNDGWEDLLVMGYRTNYGDVLREYLGEAHGSELARLYRNRGDGTFEEVSASVGLDKILFGMGSNFGDLDNDGWLDPFIGTGDAWFHALLPNRVFRNDAGRRFQEVTSLGFGLYQKGHGVAFADLDHDGDQDVYVTMGGAYAGDHARNVLYENPGHGHHWITLILEGVDSNRSAIGSRVRIHTEGPDGPRVLHRTVGTGGSFGASTLRVEVGLGSTTGPVAVEIDWAGSESQRLEGLAVDRAYRIREGSAAQPAGLRSLSLGGR